MGAGTLDPKNAASSRRSRFRQWCERPGFFRVEAVQPSPHQNRSTASCPATGLMDASRPYSRLPVWSLLASLLLMPMSAIAQDEIPDTEGSDGQEEVETTEETTEAAWGEGDKQRLEDIRDELTAVETLQRVLTWYRITANENTMLADTYRGHDALFSTDSLAFLDRALDQKEWLADERRALERLKLMLAYHYVAMRVAPFDDRRMRAEREQKTHLSWKGEGLSYRQLQNMLRNSASPDLADPAKVQEITMAISRLEADVLLPLMQEREQLIRSLALEMGFSSYIQLSEAYRELPLRDMLFQASRFIVDTDPLQKRLMAQLHQTQPPSLPAPLERYFPEEQLPKLLRRTLRGIGLSLRTTDGISIRLQALDHKAVHAVTIAPRVPQDVRVAFTSAKGEAAAEALLSAAGQAIYFANVRTPQYELQQSGIEAYALGAGEFLRQLLTDPDFLRQYRQEVRAHNKGRLRHRLPVMSDAEIATLVRWGAWQLLNRLRSEAFADLALEAAVHGASQADLTDALELLGGDAPSTIDAREAQRALCRALYARAQLRTLNEDEVEARLVGISDLLGSGDQARASLLAALAHESLRSRFGAGRFSQAETGKWLQERWNEGATLSLEGLTLALSGQSIFEDTASLASAGGTALNGSALNGSALNGTGANGSGLNGSALNGTAANGAAGNGSALNGTAANGAAGNGGGEESLTGAPASAGAGAGAASGSNGAGDDAASATTETTEGAEGQDGASKALTEGSSRAGSVPAARLHVQGFKAVRNRLDWLLSEADKLETPRPFY